MVYDIMHYTELHNIPGLLLLVDFKKAFDSLPWSFIERALDIFNFKTSIKIGLKHLIKMLFLEYCKTVTFQTILNYKEDVDKGTHSRRISLQFVLRFLVF